MIPEITPASACPAPDRVRPFRQATATSRVAALPCIGTITHPDPLAAAAHIAGTTVTPTPTATSSKAVLN